MTTHQFKTYRVIELVMNNETFTSDDLANEIGITPKMAKLHLKNLWVLNLMYICGWEKRTKTDMPIYKWGNRQDAPKPLPKTKQEIDRRYRERKKERSNVSQNISV